MEIVERETTDKIHAGHFKHADRKQLLGAGSRLFRLGFRACLRLRDDHMKKKSPRELEIEAVEIGVGACLTLTKKHPLAKEYWKWRASTLKQVLKRMRRMEAA